MMTFSRKVSHTLNLEIISQGQIFGYEDLLQNRFYSKQVKCISGEGHLYKVPADLFFEKFMSDETTCDYLKERASNYDFKTINTLITNYRISKKHMMKDSHPKYSSPVRSGVVTRQVSPEPSAKNLSLVNKSKSMLSTQIMKSRMES